MKTPFMPILRLCLIVFGVCCLTLAGRGQIAGWNTLHYGKAIFSYPRTWHMTNEKNGKVTRVTLTPDSMQHLTMRMVIIFDLPVSGDHNFSFFKRNFTALLQPSIGADGKLQKTAEITFKAHKAMYAEYISSSLPTKVYGIDAGTDIYVVVLTPRRYSQVPDPGIERDGMAILNSVRFGE